MKPYIAKVFLTAICLPGAANNRTVPVYAAIFTVRAQAKKRSRTAAAAPALRLYL